MDELDSHADTLLKQARKRVLSSSWKIGSPSCCQDWMTRTDPKWICWRFIIVLQGHNVLCYITEFEYPCAEQHASFDQTCISFTISFSEVYFTSQNSNRMGTTLVLAAGNSGVSGGTYWLRLERLSNSATRSCITKWTVRRWNCHHLLYLARYHVIAAPAYI